MITRRRSLQIIGAGVSPIALAPIAALLPATGLAAGSQPPESPQDGLLAAAKMLAGAGQNSLTLLIPKGSRANITPVAQSFTASTGVTVDIAETTVDEINTSILVNSMSGSSNFDVALPATFGIPDLVSADALLPLDDFEEKYRPLLRDSAALYQVGDKFLGKTYGFQTDGDVYVMFYRKSFFEDAAERAGFADRNGWELKVPDTWQELDAILAHFHRPDDGRYGGALFRNPGYMVWEWWIRLHANGGWPVDDRFMAQINAPAGVDALENLLATAKFMYPAAASDGLFANWRAFAEGNIACNIGWGGSQKYFNSEKSKIRGDLLFGKTPGFRTGGRVVHVPYFNWGWNYTVSRYSKQAELAYLFARYAVSSAISAKAVRQFEGYFDPFRPEHYSDPEIQRVYSNNFLDVHAASMESCIPDFCISGKGAYFDILIETIGAVMSGKETAKQALDIAAKQWDLLSNRLGRDGQVAQWQALKQHYPRAIADYIQTASG